MTVGIRVGSRYLAADMIGRGSFGTVFRGSGPHGPVAIKLLRPDLAADPQIVDRFLRERSVLIRLRHPNLVRVHDLVAESDLLALVMDLVDGPDLRAVLTRRGPLPVPAARALLAGVADALGHAHAAGVVHRDLKPENVLLDRGDELAPRLTDFGIARLAAAASMTGPQSVVGTPGYLAPEVAQGVVATPAADVYAAGVLLYELVAGAPPFRGEHALAVIHQQLTEMPDRPAGLPEDVAGVLAACLEREPGARPTTAELAGVLRGRPPVGPRGTQLVPVLARPTSAPPTSGPPTSAPPAGARGGGAHSAGGRRPAGHAVVTPPPSAPVTEPPTGVGPLARGWPLRIAILVVVAVLGIAGGYALRAGTAPTTAAHPAATGRTTPTGKPTPAPTAVRHYVSDLPYTQVANGWGPVEHNHAAGGQGPDDGGPIVLAGTTYQHGLGTNSPSQVRLYPAAACTRFTATIGIDAAAAAVPGGTVSFQVSGDGKPLYDSGIVNWQTPPKPVDVDVTGVQVLDLVVTDGGDGPANDNADWADATLLCRS